MEVLGIGRPSTYSSCVNNVLKKEYTEIRNVPGIEKETNMISMNYKTPGSSEVATEQSMT